MSRSAAPGDTDLLLQAFHAGLDAVAPQRVVPPALPAPPSGRTVVVGAGKASAAMAHALETHWTGELNGLVAVPTGYAVPCERVEVVEASHPVPDETGWRTAQRMLQAVRGLGPDDLVITLFSGGGSALLPLPAGAVTLNDKRGLTTQLLRSGATIGEINSVRKHLSAIKGGRLALAAAPAPVVNLLISDVAGDDPAIIASGPALPDSSSLADARRVLDKYGLEVPVTIREHLADPGNETPKPGDPKLGPISTRIVASANQFLDAAAASLNDAGLPAFILSDALAGEAAQVALVQAAIAREIGLRGRPFAPPCVLLSGGETTVTVRGGGSGGPNLEFLLGLVVALGDTSNIAALACDTDGSDGSSGVAGAVVRPDTSARAAAAGLDARGALERNDSLAFFQALGDLVITGPTFNNVNDFRALVVRPRAGTRLT